MRMENLSAYLKQQNLTQTAFAARLHISSSHLSLLLAGKKTPSLALAVRIERVTAGAIKATSWVLAPIDQHEGAA